MILLRRNNHVDEHFSMPNSIKVGQLVAVVSVSNCEPMPATVEYILPKTNKYNQCNYLWHGDIASFDYVKQVKK